MAMKTRYNVVNGQVLSETRSGVRRDYLTDGLGNTLALLDNTQTKTDTFDYFPSGTVAVRTGATPTPFQWNGGIGYFKDSASRTYVRARTLNTLQGRWMTQDPIGFKGGDINLYRYVNNRPTVLVDPIGLFPWVAAAIILSIVVLGACVHCAKQIDGLGLSGDDKRLHCMYGCLIRKRCTYICGNHLLGVLKEIMDFFFGGTVEWADVTATNTGVSCGGDHSRTCSACCASSGYP